MAYKITCKDAGIPTCPFEVTAETEDEAMKVASQHAQSAHNMKVTPELAAKVKSIIKTV
ncbi:MAG: DUF1059 domain-containing protein [Chloroflexi bacterium]|nr:DUF1059 domain-containing protein [Chloroflexota bacterium]